METFIMETYKSNEKEQKDRIGEYQSARVIAQIQPSPYAYVKAWFLEEYGDEYNKYRKSEDKDDKVANINSAEKKKVGWSLHLVTSIYTIGARISHKPQKGK